MARELLRHGYDVRVVTAFPHHLGYRDRRYAGKVLTREADGDIPVIRTWIYPAPSGSFWRRLVSYFSFVVSSYFGLRRSGRSTYLLVESPPLFLGITAYVQSRRWHVPYILSVSDLWPASAVALGLVKNRWAIRVSENLERFLYRHAYRVSAVTEGIRDAIRQTGLLPAEHVLFAPNGVDPARFQVTRIDPDLHRRLDPASHRIFLYPGTIGYAQGLEVILDAAQSLRERPDILFLLVGDGPVREELEHEARRRGLQQVWFEGLQPLDRMPQYFALARAVIVPLRRHPLFSGARPSKAFPAWAAGVPVIFSGEGEMAGVVAESGAGITVPPGDGGALAAAVRGYADLDAEALSRQAENARRFVLQHYAWEGIMDRWIQGLGPDARRARASDGEFTPAKEDPTSVS
jgi:colanic acid biosynthesis glycosyl transferase WcaI